MCNFCSQLRQNEARRIRRRKRKTRGFGYRGQNNDNNNLVFCVCSSREKKIPRSQCLSIENGASGPLKSEQDNPLAGAANPLVRPPANPLRLPFPEPLLVRGETHGGACGQWPGGRGEPAQQSQDHVGQDGELQMCRLLPGRNNSTHLLPLDCSVHQKTCLLCKISPVEHMAMKNIGYETHSTVQLPSAT